MQQFVIICYCWNRKPQLGGQVLFQKLNFYADYRKQRLCRKRKGGMGYATKLTFQRINSRATVKAIRLTQGRPALPFNWPTQLSGHPCKTARIHIYSGYIFWISCQPLQMEEPKAKEKYNGLVICYVTFICCTQCQF